jgi:Zn-dependent protease with chaperone function
MLSFTGSYFDGKTSKAHPVQAVFDGQNLRLDGVEITFETPINRVGIEPTLGRTRRILTLGAGRLETADLETISSLETTLGRNAGMTLVDRLERRWGFVLMSFVVILALVGGSLVVGIPWLADRAAYATPTGVLDTLTAQTLNVLKAQFLRPTKLSQEDQARVSRIFQRVTADLGGAYPYRLELHDSPALGANALALPSGTVVVTDSFVRLARSDDEIVGVLGHEVGHVIRRHALRQLYQSVGVFALASVVLGDFAGITNLGASLPVILLQSGYSRQAETEADEVGGRYLISRGVGTKPLRDILNRLTAQTIEITPSLLRSHPGTPERIAHLKRLEAGTK